MNGLSKEESGRLLALLEEHVRRADLSQRELERRLGVSQGYIGALFKGRIQLTVAHVYALAKVLNKDPLDFFLAASPAPNSEWLLKQLGIPATLRPSFQESGALPNREEVLEIIRTTIRAELEALLRVSPADDQG